MKLKQTQLMGKIVTVTATLKGITTDRTRTIHRVECRKSRAGWVVGFRWLKEGRLDYHYDEPTEFIATKNHAVMMVAYWPTMKPVAVPMDGFTEGGTPVAPGWDDQKYRTTAREEMKHFLRDSRGRLLRYANRVCSRCGETVDMFLRERWQFKDGTIKHKCDGETDYVSPVCWETELPR